MSSTISNFIMFECLIGSVALNISRATLLMSNTVGELSDSLYEGFNDKNSEKSSMDKYDVVRCLHKHSTQVRLDESNCQPSRLLQQLARVVVVRGLQAFFKRRARFRSLRQYIGFHMGFDGCKKIRCSEGCGHGLSALTEVAGFYKKAADNCASQGKRCIVWDEASVSVPCPLTSEPTNSGKNARGRFSCYSEVFI